MKFLNKNILNMRGDTRYINFTIKHITDLKKKNLLKMC